LIRLPSGPLFLCTLAERSRGGLAPPPPNHTPTPQKHPPPPPPKRKNNTPHPPPPHPPPPPPHPTPRSPRIREKSTLISPNYHASHLFAVLYSSPSDIIILEVSLSNILRCEVFSLSFLSHPHLTSVELLSSDTRGGSHYSILSLLSSITESMA